MKIYRISEHTKVFERIFSDVQETLLDIENISGKPLPYHMNEVETQILSHVSPRMGCKFELEVGECEDTSQDIFIQECINALRDPSSYFERTRAKT